MYIQQYWYTLMCVDVVHVQIAPLLESLSSLDAPLSAASPVQEANLTQYKHALQQARLSLNPFLNTRSC